MVLEAAGVPTPKTCIIIQDPTMALRTVASFEKTYGDLENPPYFLSCPIFVPNLQILGEEFQYSVGGPSEADLWDMGRFFDLIMGEVPRLRDDDAGYGPKGKGFITHVDLPQDVEDAWQRMRWAVAPSCGPE